jgi:ferredoxin
MSKIFKQLASRSLIGISRNPIDVEVIHHIVGKPSSYERNGKRYICSCLSCQNPKCMKFDQSELKISNDKLSEFPADLNDAVCPMNAIQWERNNKTPTIFAEHCINCGICARRCPVGAIYSDGNSAAINCLETDIDFVSTTDKNVAAHKTQIDKFSLCKHVGSFFDITDDTIGSIYDKLRRQQTDAQFPNLIVRNMLIVLGNRCIIRRHGDVYFRIDAIAENANTIGIVEVEFNKESLESPRAILDDIAVLSARYGISKEQIKPFIVSLEFPNIRTEYWRVIKDINAVLGVKIHSLSLGAVCILTSCFSLMPIEMVDFYADIDSASIKNGIKSLTKIETLENISGRAIFEPQK